jgi:hypothetical protein
MNKNDITYCLFSSTKGHWGIRDRYKATVENMLSQIPADVWSRMIAHIKITPGEEDIFHEMETYLRLKGFEVIGTTGNWQHSDNSHQVEYLKDMIKITNFVKTNYLFFAEDDFLIKCDNKELSYWISEAQRMLIQHPDFLQFRIPRFGNEFERINLLKKKHNIDTRAEWMNHNYFCHSDFSNNPHLVRTRDFRAALTLVKLGAFEAHSEHGLGKALKLFGQELPLVCFNPENVHCAHIGTKPGEEDDLNNIAMEKLIS